MAGKCRNAEYDAGFKAGREEAADALWSLTDISKPQFVKLIDTSLRRAAEDGKARPGYVLWFSDYPVAVKGLSSGFYGSQQIYFETDLPPMGRVGPRRARFVLDVNDLVDAKLAALARIAKQAEVRD